MHCELIRQDLLQRDWTTDDLRVAGAMLDHINGCADCRRALDDYDQLRAHLRLPAPQPEHDWLDFEQRLTHQVTSPPRRLRWHAPLALAVSVALLLAGYGLATLVRDAGGGPSAQPVATELRFTPQDASAHAAAFRQVADVFGQRTSWVMVSDRASDVGLAQRPLEPARRLLLVRLALTHEGRSVATSDVAILPGQSANLRVPLSDGQSVRYRISTTAAAASRLSIGAEITGDSGDAEPIAALATQLPVTPGQSARAGEMNSVSGPFRLSVAFAQADLPAGEPAQ